MITIDLGEKTLTGWLAKCNGCNWIIRSDVSDFAMKVTRKLTVAHNMFHRNSEPGSQKNDHTVDVTPILLRNSQS